MKSNPFFKMLSSAAALLALSAVCGLSAQTVKSLSPEGERILSERLAAFPAFDESAVRDEAMRKFQIWRKGEAVEVSVRGRSVQGVFNGVEGRYLVIDDTRIPLMDLSEETLLKTDTEKSKGLREDFVANARELAETDLAFAEERQRAGLYLNYPALDERLLSQMFAPVRNASRRMALMEEFEALYNKSLPIADGSRKDFMLGLADRFTSRHPELAFNSGRIWGRAEMDADGRRKRELDEARSQRLKDRILKPKAATPVFEPDGGAFDPFILVSIRCSTPGAEIHYTCDGSLPDEDSPVYGEPIRLAQPQLLKAIAFHHEFNDSETSQTAAWTGLGLSASYFAKPDFTGATLLRTDKELDFDWGARSPDAEIPPDFFSAIWTGTLTAPESGDYTLFLSSSDAVRLWFDGRLLIDGSDGQAIMNTYTAKVSLVAGKPCPLKVAYSEYKALSKVRLEWSGPGIRRDTIPQSFLTPAGLYSQEMERWNRKEGGAYVERPSMENPGVAGGSRPLSRRGGE